MILYTTKISDLYYWYTDFVNSLVHSLDFSDTNMSQLSDYTMQFVHTLLSSFEEQSKQKMNQLEQNPTTTVSSTPSPEMTLFNDEDQSLLQSLVLLNLHCHLDGLRLILQDNNRNDITDIVVKDIQFVMNKQTYDMNIHFILSSFMISDELQSNVMNHDCYLVHSSSMTRPQEANSSLISIDCTITNEHSLSYPESDANVHCDIQCGALAGILYTLRIDVLVIVYRPTILALCRFLHDCYHVLVQVPTTQESPSLFASTPLLVQPLEEESEDTGRKRTDSVSSISSKSSSQLTLKAKSLSLVDTKIQELAKRIQLNHKVPTNWERNVVAFHFSIGEIGVALLTV